MDELYCNKYFYETNKIPPLNLVSWVSVYNLILNKSYEDLKKEQNG